MLKKRIVALWLFFILALIPRYCLADSILLEEDFSSTTKVDMKKTDAVIEPDELNDGKPLLKLPRESAQHAMDFIGDGLVIAEKDSVKWYSTETGTMSEVYSYQSKDDGDIVGVLAIPNTQSVYAWSNNKIMRLDFDGSGISKNPVFPTVGLEKVVTVTQLEQDVGEPYLAILGKDTSGSYVKQVWGFDDTGTYLKINEETVPGNPLAITGGLDYTYYIDYNDKSEQYKLNGAHWSVNAGYNFSHSSPPISTKGQKNDKVVLDKDSIRWYNWTGDEHVLSQTLSQNITKGITLAVHHDDYKYAYIDESGSVSYYQFDGESMVENPSLKINGLQVLRRYIHPKMYQSKPLVTSDGKKHNVARLEVDSLPTNPLGVDEVTWEVSTDGGSTWQTMVATQPNDTPIWIKISPSSETWLLRAKLDTKDDIDTPRIRSIKLSTTYMDVYDIQIENVSGVPAAYPVPPPALAKAGSEVAFTLKTKGVIGRVETVMTDGNGSFIDTVPLTLKTSNQDDENQWAGKFVIPLNFKEAYSGNIFLTVVAYNDHLTGSDLDIPITYGPIHFLTFGGELFGPPKLRLF
ncbi:hypothetical protein AM501_23890 [Aneurinibacillus migulanus]|uniref:hypothetical protein n=1 Tax=Aneurinibacillus migulanus TaxID=47500 RepID=UPI0005B7DA9D|nr:hypothetical protein [Aneurinibacillus migulanus]KIV58949.1 hypothetical protein TS64_04090 [Aneurinibacillus migulanus]KPD05819.1 hypothetical protein AM501_23890 [Aneurinibacillus migulanus]